MGQPWGRHFIRCCCVTSGIVFKVAPEDFEAGRLQLAAHSALAGFFIGWALAGRIIAPPTGAAADELGSTDAAPVALTAGRFRGRPLAAAGRFIPPFPSGNAVGNSLS